MRRRVALGQHRAGRASPLAGAGPRSLAVATAALCAVAVGCGGCGPSPEQQEARRVLGLIDRMRQATPAEREPVLEELERTTIRGAAATQARRRCARAYRSLLEGRRLESEVRQQLAFPSPPPSVLQKLAQAERKVEDAAAQMPRCNEALAALRRVAR